MTCCVKISILSIKYFKSLRCIMSRFFLSWAYMLNGIMIHNTLSKCLFQISNSENLLKTNTKLLASFHEDFMMSPTAENQGIYIMSYQKHSWEMDLWNLFVSSNVNILKMKGDSYRKDRKCKLIKLFGCPSLNVTNILF